MVNKRVTDGRECSRVPGAWRQPTLQFRKRSSMCIIFANKFSGVREKLANVLLYYTIGILTGVVAYSAVPATVVPHDPDRKMSSHLWNFSPFMLFARNSVGQ